MFGGRCERDSLKSDIVYRKATAAVHGKLGRSGLDDP
jgi:hypothetical protein